MLSDIEPFGLTLLIAAAVVTLALLSNRISVRVRIPAPVIFLLAAAAASDLIPPLQVIGIGTVEQIVTVALLVILVDGGMHIGYRRLRGVLGAVFHALADAGTISDPRQRCLSVALFGERLARALHDLRRPRSLRE